MPVHTSSMGSVCSAAWRAAVRSGVLFAALVCLGVGANNAWGLDQAAAVELAREFPASDDRSERRQLAAELTEFDEVWEPVIQQLQTRTFEPVKPGYYPQESFTDPALLKEHPVNGKQRFQGRVEPSLVTALKSFERRRDWGLIYPLKIELNLAAGSQH